MMVNTQRITGIDGTDGASVTKGMIQGRREILQLLEVMRKHFPGCHNARLRTAAPLLGVRETRRIVGDFDSPCRTWWNSARLRHHRLHRLRVGPAGPGQTQPVRYMAGTAELLAMTRPTS